MKTNNLLLNTAGRCEASGGLILNNESEYENRIRQKSTYERFQKMENNITILKKRFSGIETKLDQLIQMGA